MIAKFNLYDFIAVLIPGLFFLWVTGPLLGLLGVFDQGSGLSNATILLTVGYVTGLLLQGISQNPVEKILKWWWGGLPSARWLLLNDDHWTSQKRQAIYSAILARFDVDLNAERLGSGGRNGQPAALKRAGEIFRLCYRSIEKKSEFPQIFNAQYGLFRCLFLTCLLSTVIAVGQAAAHHQAGALTRADIAVGCGLAVAALVAYARVKKRGEDFAAAVYDVFLVQQGRARPPAVV